MTTTWQPTLYAEDWEKFTTIEISSLVNSKVKRLQGNNPTTYDDAMHLAQELASIVMGMNVLIGRIGGTKKEKTR